MSNRFKKVMLLVGMGGAVFAFGFMPDLGSMGCIRNNNLTNFYQNVGTAALAETVDSVRDALAPAYPEGGDFDNIVVTPTANFLNSMWTNWVAQQFPADLDNNAILEQ